MKVILEMFDMKKIVNHVDNNDRLHSVDVNIVWLVDDFSMTRYLKLHSQYKTQWKKIFIVYHHHPKRFLGYAMNLTMLCTTCMQVFLFRVSIFR